ncbi:MAG: class I SAM-dependent methyltransferase [Ignavibacteriaceae bacterium]|nr:class I SAM-dependent methyltransferase [Ignavibacteriaceae bacterium]
MKNYLHQKYDLSDPKIVSAFDEMPLWSSYFGAVLLDTVIYKNKARILDIGCGAGYPMLELAQRFGADSEVTGIDPWKAATARLKAKAKIMGVNNIRIINGVAENIPTEDNYFDLIVSNNGLNNCSDQMKVLSECYRTMKKDGQLVFTVNLPGSMKEFYSLFRQILTDQKLNDSAAKMELHIKEKRKTLQENLRQVRKNRFTVKRIIEQSFYMKYLNGTAFLNHYFIKIAFLDSWVKIVPQNKRGMIFKLLEEKLNQYSQSKGELRITIPFVCIDCRKSG